MTLWKAILLGLIQGLGEFLPISSSGHLILAQKLLGIEGDWLFFDLLLHGATLLAVVFILRGDLLPMVKRPFCRKNLLIALSALPTVGIALVLDLYCRDAVLGRYLPVGFMLTAVLLTAAGFWGGKGNFGEANLTAPKSLLAGAVQGLAALPGLSRSGSTISTLTLLGMKKEDAVRFSFLMSIPIIAGSMLYEGLKGGFVGVPLLPAVCGSVAAFLSGVFALKFMIKVFSRAGNLPFVIYLAGVSLFSLFAL